MQDILIVVDMQNDFISGALGSPAAQKAVQAAEEKIRAFAGRVIFTQDTHGEDYAATQEGRLLRVSHCLRGSQGWQIHPQLESLRREPSVQKGAFGSVELGRLLQQANEEEPIRSVTLIGICTDICVISNALIVKAFLPEAQIIVDAAACAGTTPQNHRNALSAMRCCQIHIENETPPQAETIRLATVNIDCADAQALGDFYCRLLGWERAYEEEEFIIIRGPAGGAKLSFQKEACYVPPVWPEEPGQQQKSMHLDIQVADLDAAQAHALACGAVKAPQQYLDDCRVFFDPAGHPFCLFVE